MMENSIHMLASVSGGQMNSFIITTGEGGVIVIDGGYETDTDNLIAHLKQITGQPIPHIDGWFLSHAHSDHITAFVDIVNNRWRELDIDTVYYNFPSIQFFEKNEAPRADRIKEFYRLLPVFSDKICIITQGDRYEIKGALFDVLYTTDPAFTHNAANNSSSVFRMTLGGKTTLFLGDCGIEAGNKLLSLYGHELKSDYCQMAHHGQAGVTREVYEAIAPTGCLWCTPLWLWDNDAGLGFNTHTFQTVAVRGWMKELGVAEHYVTKDGDQVIRL